MTDSTPSDLTVTAARTQRDALADRIDVLDKVGVLRTLPDDMHVTTEMVAEFYGVDREAIASLVKRNRDEFDDDGYAVIVRSAFEERFAVNLSTQSARIALFPRRAVLRVGMLLRDSEIAKRVRTYLLDVEQAARPAIDGNAITRLELIHIAMNAETERLALEAENKVLSPKAEAYDSFLDATGKYSIGTVAKMLGSSQNKLFRDLRNNGVLISKGSMRNTPYQQYMRYFEVRAHEYERSNGEPGCSYTTYVQPAGIDFIRRKLDLPTIDPLPLTLDVTGGAA